jgi:hypothetical protein
VAAGKTRLEALSMDTSLSCILHVRFRSGFKSHMQFVQNSTSLLKKDAKPRMLSGLKYSQAGLFYLL